MGRAIVNKPLGLGDNCLGPRKGGSTPYYLFGTQRRYAYAWHGGPGGVPNGYRAAESRAMGGLGMFDSLSDNERKLAYGAAAAAALLVGYKLLRRRRGRR